MWAATGWARLSTRPKACALVVSMTRNRLLVVGAGPVGLAMANALRLHDIEYDHVETKTALGGNWNDGVYEGVHLNSSKRSTEFGDYPMPDDYPLFPSAAQTRAYIEDYARVKGLDQRIRFNTEVRRAEPLPDDTWKVLFQDGRSQIYKGVVVCNGHHWDKRMPNLPGRFSGEVIHSKDYKRVAQLQGKRVLVIGAGNSGCDIACDAARVGASSDISMRNGYWFLPRLAFGRALHDLPIWHLPVTLQRWIMRGIISVTVGDYRRYGLERPNHRLFDRHTAFGAELLDNITKGKIRPRRGIERVDGKTVHFADGAQGQYDLIVAATGFNMSFPFLPEGLVTVVDNVVQVYGYAFPANVKNLYFVGGSQPRAGFGYLLTPLADLYASVIKMQDELEHPIGAILEFMGEKIPNTHLVDPGGASREILMSRMMLAYVRWQGRRLAGKRSWVAPVMSRVPAGEAEPLLPMAAE